MSSIAASDATGRSAEAARRSSLRSRIISALVLAPAAFVCVWFGTPWFELMVAAATLVMAWEWRRVCGAGAFGPAGLALVAAVGAANLLTAAGQLPWALVAIAAGAIVVLVLARGEAGAAWSAAGAFAVGLPAVALVWLRADPAHGLELILWLVGAVCATDIAAFFAGRAIGGPKLAPRISPKKTWAGLAGGAAAAAVWTVGFGLWAGWSGPVMLAVLGLLAAVVAQIGDLTESLVKRRFGVKDASSLIPGHGGMLDRADGYLVSAPVLALLVAVGRNGVGPWA